MVCGFTFSRPPRPLAGLGYVSFASSTASSWRDFRAIMNILVVTGFILPAALVCTAARSPFKAGAIGLVLRAVAATVMAILGNLVITPMDWACRWTRWWP